MALSVAIWFISYDKPVSQAHLVYKIVFENKTNNSIIIKETNNC